MVVGGGLECVVAGGGVLCVVGGGLECVVVGGGAECVVEEAVECVVGEPDDFVVCVVLWAVALALGVVVVLGVLDVLAAGVVLTLA